MPVVRVADKVSKQAVRARIRIPAKIKAGKPVGSKAEILGRDKGSKVRWDAVTSIITVPDPQAVPERIGKTVRVLKVDPVRDLIKVSAATSIIIPRE
jgi:hypothetical protein